MKTADSVIAALKAYEERNGSPPRAIVLSPKTRLQLLSEVNFYWLSYPQAIEMFMGVPVYRRRFSMFCTGCGAPAEGKACSYCGTDPDEVEVL